MKAQEFMRKYLDMVSESNLEEKWGTPTKVSPEERGKYAGKSKAELLTAYNALKKSGPHKKEARHSVECASLLLLSALKADGVKLNNL